MTRRPVVAGQFYPGRSAQLKEEVVSLMRPTSKKRAAIGVVAPHAGYMYSGGVAGYVYASIKEIKPSAVIIGPNHTGFGAKFSLMSEEAWLTPLGEVKVDKGLASQILKNSKLIKEDKLAHASEHSVEVQLPFLQVLKPDIKFVPIVASYADADTLITVGKDIAKAIEASGKETLIVASSDMTHYESHQQAKTKDEKAIDAILKLDEAELIRRVEKYNISMCGYAPTAIMLAAAKELGAKKAELVKYQTSGDTSGDFSSVVGYAGIIVS